ncbi:MAG: serine hydrolase [Acetatifactor sp.]|nr:serine hydrolase [Acetatifactor sp.]
MELREQIQSVMERAVEECLVAGVNFLVEQDGEEVLYAQAGMASRESGRQMSRDTIFRLYSQTKPVTAAAVMLLMERGEVDLFQSVGEFLPAYRNLKVAGRDGSLSCADRPLTLHDLLGMTSGLVYPDGVTPSGKAAAVVYEEAVSRLYTDHEMTTAELAERLAEGPLAFTPGSSWQYGTSADVLGAVVEAVTGKRFSEFLAEEIFRPLGMEDTGFWVPREKRHRLAEAYETVTDDKGKAGFVHYTGDNLAVCNRMDHEPAYAAGGAGLVSTLEDYRKFARMLLNGGSFEGKRILKPGTVRFMTGGELSADQQRSFDNWVGLNGFSYCSLMRVCRNPARAGMQVRWGEYGWDGWLGMYFANFPEERMTILMGAQKKDSGTFSLTRKLRNLVLGE